jgi:uncharacterized membrane protein YjgN (DUF898 family)
MEFHTLATDYAGRRGPLLWLAIRTSILNVLTLGIYRFWMKTRIRRYFWSAIRPGGVPLEYSGTGTEKFLGFLFAVVVVAFYIGVFNLILMFLSFSLLNDNYAAYVLSFAGVVPLYFFARYRARRYILARTRWRGVRFGAEPAAWAFSGTAIWHIALTLLTAGFLLPRQVYMLEKFRTDRTWYGTARFHQGGQWRDLLRPARHYHIGLILCWIAVIGGLAVDDGILALLALGVPWLVVGLVRLQVQGFAQMASTKRLGSGVTFAADPRTGRILWIYGFGSFLTYVLLGALVMVALFVFAFLAAMVAPDVLEDLGAVFMRQGGIEGAAVIVMAASLYFAFFVLWGALWQIFVTLPVMQHYAETAQIENAHHLAAIRQRPRDDFAEAEGFAEALDIGAAI